MPQSKGTELPMLLGGSSGGIEGYELLEAQEALSSEGSTVARTGTDNAVNAQVSSQKSVRTTVSIKSPVNDATGAEGVVRKQSSMKSQRSMRKTSSLTSQISKADSDENEFGRQLTEASRLSHKCSELLSRPTLSTNRVLLRATSARVILDGFARIFAPHEVKVANAATEAPAAAAAAAGAQQPLVAGADGEDPDKEHEAADEAFYGVPQVEKVGVFISHAWAAPRWKKALSLYYYMNCQLAVIAALLTWLSLVSWVIIRNGMFGSGGNRALLPLFVGAPMAVFALVFFTGHFVWAPVENLWLDRLCIHQTRPKMKMKGIRALPEIVAASERMLVLWSETYFERIWCNAELATFSAVNQGPSKMDFLPLWLVPWLLASMSLDMVGICISNELFVFVPEAGAFFAGHLPPKASWMISFLAQFTGIGVAFWLGYLVIIIPTWHSFRAKLNINETMLQKTKSYSLASAKCAVESDRPLIEELVRDLFATAEDPIREFNRFMNEDLAAHIAERIGRPSHIPYRVCLLVSMPLTFSSASNLLGCDDMPCAMATEVELGKGVTMAQQMATNFMAWTTGVFAIYPTTYPVMLSLMAWCRTRFGSRAPRTQAALDFLIVLFGYAYVGFHEGFAAGILNTASNQLHVNFWHGGVPWCFVVLAYFAFLVWWHFYLFGR